MRSIMQVFIIISFVAAIWVERSSKALETLFVTPKKGSTQIAKGEVTQLFAEVKQECATLVAEVNKLQQSCIKSVIDFMEQSSHPLLTDVDGLDLYNYQEKLKRLKSKLGEVVNQIKNNFTELKKELK